MISADTVGMIKPYSRHSRNGRETLYAAFWCKGYNGGKCIILFFLQKGYAATLKKKRVLCGLMKNSVYRW